MVEEKQVIDSKSITQIFGLRSNIYKLAMEYLEKQAKGAQKKKYEEKFNDWKDIYREIYGGSLDSELFLKHTYFALVLKLLVIIKLSIIQNLDLEEAYEDAILNNLEAFHVFEFENFYWTDINEKIFYLIFESIENTLYARQDLFIDFYQEIFFADMRHKIGEFYTPLNMVKEMVNDFYEFGQKILDPSCGSGSFLIDIISKIMDNDAKSNLLKIEAINNVVGFDINPLATMTAKINILLLFLEYFDIGMDELPRINIFIIDSLIPEKYEAQKINKLTTLYHSFDLVIGNPPWLTYKDLNNKDYQNTLKDLAEELCIKPSSQYITHLELAAVFFYAVTKFLKIGGKVFFIVTKSVLNGDHCYKFRTFSIFNDLEIWDFPNNIYFFNIPHVCLKGKYIGKDDGTPITEKYPIKAKIFNKNLEVLDELLYSSLKIEEKGARVILPVHQLELLNKTTTSPYKSKFFQGATLVPRTLVFFQVENKDNEQLTISSDPDIMSRAKKNWRHYFQNKKIERDFRFRTFLNKDLIPFLLKKERNVFLPVNESFEFSTEHLKNHPAAFNYYTEMNEIYKEKKKNTSEIETLFDNLNYWNKLTKQHKNKKFLVVYNASGSNLKAAVIVNWKKRIVIGSENYYFSTDSKDEAYYLSSLLNSPILSKNIKMIKSSRHIHKRPFTFPIPLFDEKNKDHLELARVGKKNQAVVQDFVLNNPKINSDKIRMLINKNLVLLNLLAESVIFKNE